jgi:alpha-beta hydrolase superfamily lysophospholipase
MKSMARWAAKTILALFILLNIITAFHAYKFTHFYDRGERIIKKETEKNGWDKTKELLFGFNFEKQLNGIPDTAYQTLYLRTSDGLKLEAWLMKVKEPKGTVALFHGHGGKKSSALFEASRFRQLGYNTLLLDFRAHGNSQGNTCTIGYKESEDVKLAYDYLQHSGEKNIILWGISLGAATITKAMYDYHLQPSRLILEMPFASLLKAVEGRMRIMKLPPEPFAGLLTFWGGVEHGFWAFNLKPSAYAASIYCPVLIQHGILDTRVSADEIKDIYQNIPGRKILVNYENSGHESLCSKEPGKWMTNITEFMK